MKWPLYENSLAGGKSENSNFNLSDDLQSAEGGMCPASQVVPQNNLLAE